MNIQLFDKESSITTSAIYFAYQILKVFDKRKTKSLSFFQLAKSLKDTNPEANEKQFMYALIFLYTIGVVDADGIDVRIVGSANA